MVDDLTEADKTFWRRLARRIRVNVVRSLTEDYRAYYSAQPWRAPGPLSAELAVEHLRGLADLVEEVRPGLWQRR